MSGDIVNEVIFMLHSVAMGILITFVYDWLLILRRLVRHNGFFVSLEDLVFWILCAVCVFYMLYRENDGILRWVAVFGAGLGMLVYKKTVSPVFVRFVSAGAGKVLHVLGKMFSLLFRPFRWIFGKIGNFFRFLGVRGKKAGRHAKKKLTHYKKMLRIVLCKH